MLDLLKDLWGFASERKKFWLVPLIGTASRSTTSQDQHSRIGSVDSMMTGRRELRMLLGDEEQTAGMTALESGERIASTGCLAMRPRDRFLSSII